VGERMISLFVYGTLLTGEENHDRVSPYVIAVESGTVRGTLYDVGDYPALVPDPEGELISGEWLTIMPEGLAEVDALENYRGPEGPNEYDRIWIKDALNAEKEGWIYVYPDSRGLPKIAEGTWRGYINKKDKLK
jgi:gamma-glutamylcyclotransferase (GGCT)/AIG2-like uncharacterized protein YtfP